MEATSVSAGNDFSLAVADDGKTYAWGRGDAGQLGVINGTIGAQRTPKPVLLPSGVKATSVSAGTAHSLTTGSDGKAYAWGKNHQGQLGDNTTTNRNTPFRVLGMDGVMSPVTVTSPAHNANIEAKGATFTGTATANSTVVITNAAGTQVGTTKANPDGTWSTTLKLPHGATKLTFTALGQTATWSGLVLAETVIDSATAGPEGITVRGWAHPGALMKTTDDPNQGWWEPESGETIADKDGAFTFVTHRTNGGSPGNGQAMAAAFNMATTQIGGTLIGRAEPMYTVPSVSSAVRAPEGMTVRGWAHPGAVMKTTNDPNKGWWDPEGGEVTAAKDGSFTLVTHRMIEGKAVVAAFNTANTRIGTSAPVDPTWSLQVTSPTEGTEIGTTGALFQGFTKPGSTVEITDAQKKDVGSAVADTTGTWKATLKLPVGSASLTFTADGKTTSWTGTVIDDTPRAVTSPANGEVIDPNTEFTGTGKIGDTVTITDKDGTVLGQATVGTDGKWSTTLDPAPGNGPVELVITATGKDGSTETIANNTYTMTGSVNAFKVLSPVLAPNESVKNGTVFAGVGHPGSAVAITDKDGTVVGETVVDEDGNWSTSITGLAEGPNRLTATATLDGHDPWVIDLGPVVIVGDDPEEPVMDPALAGGAALALLAAAGTVIAVRRRVGQR